MNDDERSDDERSDDERSSDEDERGEYIHFDDAQQCSDFIHYIKKLDYTVGHTCCSGNGCEVLNIDNATSHKIKKEFLATYQQTGI
jgi:hypothetical protein